MGLEGPEFIDDNDAGGGKPLSSLSVSCSICLELVSFDNERSCVKLICGHEFHLDCIGSAFNSRGAMQCPNCRNVEKGQWLYGSGGPACDDPHEEEFYDLSYSEMSVGVRWCPFTLSHLPSSFEEGEFSSAAYHDLLGHHALFAEHPSVSSSNHPCPYVAYHGPVHSSSSNSVASVSDNPYNTHWGGPSEMPGSYSLPAMDPHYHNWEHHASPLPAVANRDQPALPSIGQRSARATSDAARPGFFMHPFPVGHSSGARASSNVASAPIPPYPGSVARTRERVQALQAYSQPPSGSPSARAPLASNNARRSGSSHRSSNLHASSPDQPGGGYYAFPSSSSTWNYPEAEGQMPRNFLTWERDRLASVFPILNQGEPEGGWGPTHQPYGGGGGYRQRHGSER